MRPESFAVSFALHLAALGSLLLLAHLAGQGSFQPPQLIATNGRPLERVTKLYAPRTRGPRSGESRGNPGGGALSPLPVRKGEPRAFRPPAAVAPPSSRMTVPMVFDDAPPSIAGDPLGRAGAPGTGSGLWGIGGPGDGGVPRPGRGTGGSGGSGGGGEGGGGFARPSKWPELVYKIEPEYSEDARKARFQGSVLLACDVGTDGRPRNIRVVRGLGLGLDEKAMDAVSTWKFRPALRNGRPVAAPITVEVNFRLL